MHPLARRIGLLLLATGLVAGSASAQILRQPVPDRLVVLTFDDAVRSHATFVAPLLKRYGFGGTFFVVEFPPDFDDKAKYMTWEQIGALHEMGFEIGNHTRTHTHVDKMDRPQFLEELGYIEDTGRAHGIEKPVSFAYPGYDTHTTALPVLQEAGYRLALTGGSRAYDPEADHPYLIPSFSSIGADTTHVLDALRQARDGKIVVLTVHGVPDTAHDWVNTPPEVFEVYMDFLRDHDYTVIPLRDLERYVDVDEALRTIPPSFPTTRP